MGAFAGSHAASSTTQSRFLGSAQQRLVIPRAHKAYVWSIAGYTPTVFASSNAVLKLYVDGADQSASFTTTQAIDPTHAAGVFVPTTAPFEIDATSAEVLVDLYATLGATGASLAISATIYGVTFAV